MRIPDERKFIRITAGGEGEEYRYLYKDSSIIYITSIQGAGTINEAEIIQDPTLYNKRFFSDTLTIQGMSNNGNFWREVKCFNVFYGYSNVPSIKKALFDSVINSASVR